MKTYTATLTNLKGKDVLDLIDTMPKHVEWDINLDKSVEEETPRKAIRTNGSAILTMTGKRPQAGSLRETVLTIFEKLEAKHGIGSVSRKMLREAVVKKDINVQNVAQLMKGGFLKVL